jgi:acyl-CoA synthetase (AMP-forming)/AMP-acid ligase II
MALIPAMAARSRTVPDGMALADDSGRLSFAECADQVSRVASRLLDLASAPGERVAVVGDNAIPTLVAHLAGIAAGVGTVATSRQLTADEMTDQFRDAGVVAVITGPAGAAAARVAAARLGLRAVVTHGVPGASWGEWLRAPAAEIPQGRPCVPPLVYTSGTTGRARGTEVRWTEGAPRTAAEFVEAVAGAVTFPAGPHLVAGPLAHNGPLSCLRHLIAGEPVVVLGRFDPETCLRRVAEHRVTSSLMVPTHFQRLLALPADVRARYDVSSVRQISHTGSACPPAVKRAMIDWFGPVLVESYGASEVGTVARITSPEWLDHPGSVGRARPPFEVLVLDDDGAALPPGRTGLLAFRAPDDRGVRYHADPEKTRAAYVAPGVFTLGDVGHVDADGYIFITDRAADMVVSGGVNLYPAESEAVLLRHPGVDQVAVIGVPDPDFGESLHALIVPYGAPDVAELDAFCRSRIAAYKCPKSYEFVAELARNAMGKLDKRALRRRYWGSERTIAG